jgi:hypothetical protein
MGNARWLAAPIKIGSAEDKGEETTDVAEPPELWVGQTVELTPPNPQPTKMWATIDPKRAVAVPGTYFGFFHNPRPRPYSERTPAPPPSEPEPELGPVPESSPTRAAVVVLLALLACLACISFLVWS